MWWAVVIRIMRLHALFESDCLLIGLAIGDEVQRTGANAFMEKRTPYKFDR